MPHLIVPLCLWPSSYIIETKGLLLLACSSFSFVREQTVAKPDARLLGAVLIHFRFNLPLADLSERKLHCGPPTSLD